MIPIVRRRVTVTTQGVVDLPFSCTACGLATLAHVNAKGVGHSTTAYIAPDEVGAQNTAHANLQKNARAVVEACLCPRCGAPAQALRDAIAAWDLKTENGTRVRTRKVLAIGMGISLAIALSCLVAMVAAPTAGKTAADMIDSAICMAVGITLLGSTISLVVFFFSGPGARPKVPTSNPGTLWFDRSPGA